MNGERTDCQNYGCYVGQLSNGRINQGCRFTLEEENTETYNSFRTCETDLCNINNFDEMFGAKNSNRSSELNRNCLKILLVIFSFIQIRKIFE